jgi:DnaK suppressor protein
MAKIKKAEIKKPSVKEKPAPKGKEKKTAVKPAEKAKPAAKKAAVPVKAAPKAVVKPAVKAAIKPKAKEAAVKKPVGASSGNNKLPTPKEVRDTNRKLREATKPTVPCLRSKFGTASTVNSQDKEVVTNTQPRRVSPSLSASKRK